MRRRVWFSVALGAWLATAVYGVSAAVQAPAPSAPAAPARYRAVLDQYCVTCHNARLKTAGLELDSLDINAVGPHGDQWEKVVRKLRAGMMPPAGMPRPDAATYAGLTTFLQTSLDRVSSASPNPGRTLLHRLNRAEYANAIRDLLALEVDAAALLPPDDASYGFDNIADVLGVSPSLQERYLSAARVISQLAVGDIDIEAVSENFTAKGDLTQIQHLEGLPLGTRGGMLIRKNFPLDGEYQFSAKIFRTNEGNIRGTVFEHKFIITIDGQQVFEDVVGGPRDNPPRGRGVQNANGQAVNSTTIGDAIDARWIVRVPVTAGMHDIGVTFMQRNSAQGPELLKPFLSTFDHIETQGVPQIEHVRIAGPFNPTGPGNTPSRQRIFTCRPASVAGEPACARQILSSLAHRAYRRPVTDADIDLIMTFYENGRQQGSFEKGIQMGLRFILASPEFAFRAERDPASVRAGASYRVNDIELASRLSYFLWSSIPDEQLLQAAEQGRLRTGLVAQVRRMLDDPKAKALTDNFAGQWLYLRNLRGFSPVLDIFPDFDDNLRQAMRTETEMLFESIVQDDRSVVDLLNADYTFVNERLAKHYGIRGVYGSHFRRVQVTDPARRGLLGQGSILSVTSRPNRTSVVLRGKWVMENLLGSPPPQPPPNVPPFMEPEGQRRPKTVREQMELHRANPTCATCHRLMDPLGIALENFDAVGAWRAHDKGNPIDASTEMANGTKINGVVGLREALVSQPDVFVQTMTEKLMTYALGRGLESYDMPAVRKVVRDAAASNYRFSSIVLGIVNSTPFQMRIKPADEPAATRAAN